MAAKAIVLVGGGHTHILLLKKFAMNPVEGVRITLVSPRGSATYSGMIPGYIAGHYDLDAVQINLRALCRYCLSHNQQCSHHLPVGMGRVRAPSDMDGT